MQVQYFTQWEVVSYIQIIWFALIFIGNTILTVTFFGNGKKKTILTYSCLFSIFLLLKVAGGIAGIITLHDKNFNQSAFTATYICDSASLGLLIKSILPFIENMLRRDEDHKLEFRLDDKFNTNTRIGRRNLHPFQILTLILLVAIITTIVGTVSVASTSSPSTNSDKAVLKAGTLLFLVVVVIIGAFAVYIQVTTKGYKVIIKLLFVLVLMLLVRSIYSVLSAFKGINFENPSQYIILYGDYKYYTFMGFMMEGLVSFTLTIIYFWFLRYEKLQF